MLNNILKLSDDELDLIQTSLDMTILSHERYIEVNGNAAIDQSTKKAIEGMKKLRSDIDKKFYP